MYRNRLKEAAPTKWRTATGISQPECPEASDPTVNPNVAVPKVSSARDTNSPIRSSDLRQKMSPATAAYTAANRTSMATVYAAYWLEVKPRSPSARRPAWGSCPVVQMGVGQGTCSSANSAG